MEVMVSDVSTNKSVRVEIAPNHTVGSILETVVNGLGLPRDRAYSLVLGGKELGPETYANTVQSMAIRDGDQMDLISRPIGGF